jgi:hypothetical protein
MYDSVGRRTYLILHQKRKNMLTQLMHGRFHGLELKGTLVRDTVVFFAGFEAFHTLSHLGLGMSGLLPMSVAWFPVEVTPALNAIAVVVNALITCGLLYWAHHLTKWPGTRYD